MSSLAPTLDAAAGRTHGAHAQIFNTLRIRRPRQQGHAEFQHPLDRAGNLEQDPGWSDHHRPIQDRLDAAARIGAVAAELLYQLLDQPDTFLVVQVLEIQGGEMRTGPRLALAPHQLGPDPGGIERSQGAQRLQKLFRLEGSAALDPELGGMPMRSSRASSTNAPFQTFCA
jgi:hypothetical protein